MVVLGGGLGGAAEMGLKASMASCGSMFVQTLFHRVPFASRKFGFVYFFFLSDIQETCAEAEVSSSGLGSSGGAPRVGKPHSFCSPLVAHRVPGCP